MIYYRDPLLFLDSWRGRRVLLVHTVDELGRAHMLVAGIDSSTQSTKIVLCRAEDGEVIGQATAAHPDGTECHPRHWWNALQDAGRGLLDQADAVAVGAQQHGMVVLDGAGEVVRPAL